MYHAGYGAGPTSEQSAMLDAPEAPEASEIAPGLWQGSLPPVGQRLARLGFTHLVLMAREFQPSAALFPGVLCHYAPIDDTEFVSLEDRERIERAARAVAQAVREGGKVLVTCVQGRNRSGVVVARALQRLYFLPPADAVRTVRERRRAPSGLALSNQAFVRLLHANQRF